MAFEALPNNCILQIISHLPFKDRVRVGGVNRLFNKLSKEAIDRTRSLDLTTDLYKYCLRSYPFWQLLESCSPNLVRLNARFPFSIGMLEILPEFLYPKLDHLEMAVAHTSNDNEANRVKKSFFNLLKRNPSIRSIKLHLAYVFDFPMDVDLDGLESLEINGNIDNKEVMEAINNRGDLEFFPLDKLFESLIGRVPNLNRLIMQVFQEDGEPLGLLDHLAKPVNKLIGSLPNLTMLHLCSIDVDFIDEYPNLWTRSSLVELRWDNVTSVDYTLESLFDQDHLDKIATSFPRLQVFISNSIDQQDSSSLLVLKKLKQLRKLHVPQLFIDEPVFIEILSSFPSLVHLEIKGINEIMKAESLVDVLMKIPDMGKSVTVQFNDDEFRSIWDTDCVKAALISMKENGGSIIETKGRQNH